MRSRMTLLYGALFLLSGAVLLAIASGVARVGSTQAVPAPNQNQAVNQNGAGSQTALAQADARVRQLQDQLAAAQHNQGSSVTHQLLIGSLVALAIMAGASALLGWLHGRARAAAAADHHRDCAPHLRGQPG